MKFTKKHALLISVVAALMVLCTFAGATLAYLFTKTEPVVNTFTPSDITLNLVETPTAGGSQTANAYQMVPGTTITKDPKVTAFADVDYYVFVKIDKSENFSSFMEYEVADGWTALVGVTDVYYKAVAANTNLTNVSVLKDDEITVKDTVTKSNMNALTSATYPTLTFTAYAVQQAGFDSVAAAWQVAYQQANPTT